MLIHLKDFSVELAFEIDIIRSVQYRSKVIEKFVDAEIRVLLRALFMKTQIDHLIGDKFALMVQLVCHWDERGP